MHGRHSVRCHSVLLSVALVAGLAFAPATARTVKKKATRPALTPPPAQRTDRPFGYERTLYPVPADTFVLAEFSFNPAGITDPQGWISVDGTAQLDTFFHVDDFAGLGGGNFGEMVPLQGAQSMWCGARPSTDPPYCQYATLPGYGNNWRQSLESVPFATQGDVTLNYLMRYETEPGYDQVFVEYFTKSGAWQIERQFSGYKNFLDTIPVPADSLDGTVKFRFRLASDGAWSNEDGLWTTDGAIFLDSMTVTDDGGLVDFQDFESEPVGALASNDGDWAASVPEPYGDFASLYPGGGVLQEDGCVFDASAIWVFFDGSTYDYACGGHPGQTAVPFGEVRGEQVLYLNNEIWSPPIEFNEDRDGVPVPASADQILYEFDMYGDLPLDNLVVWNFIVREWIGTCPGGWSNFSSYEYAPNQSWMHRMYRVESLLPTSMDKIQVGVFVVDACSFWCGVFGTGACHSHGPLLDNFKVSRVAHHGPSWFVHELNLFQDGFADDGTKTGTVSIDIARDVALSSNPNYIPGDSSLAVVTTNVGLDYHMTGDPSSGPAVYCHVKDIAGGKSGGAVSGDPVRYPVVSTGGGWTVVRFDSTPTGGGSYVTDHYNVDLNDGLYVPGDTIYYYFSARDVTGVTSYYTSHAGVTSSEAEARELAMEMTCLPANAKAGLTDILYVDDYDRGAEPYFSTAFELLGIKPDRYDVLGAVYQNNGSPGNTVVDVMQQITGCYRKIIWSTGDLLQNLIGDGTEDHKADDFGLLFEFVDQHPNGAGVYISGDNVAQEWVSLAGPSAVNFRSTYMNFGLVDGNHTAVGEPVSPLGIGQPGSCFGAGPDTLIAYGGCPELNEFDVLSASGTSTVEMAYSNDPGHSAVLGQVTANTVGDTARVMLSGFSFHRIRDDKVQNPIDRVEHLMTIIRWLDNQVDDPTAIPVTRAFENGLAQNYPNPFNPTTSIHYSIAARGAVSLAVYNVAGQLVRTLVGEEQTPRPGGFRVVWDGRDNTGTRVSSGVYFYRLVTPGFTATRKMVVLK